MELFYTDHFVLPLPPGHRFPMAKYRLLRERLLASGRFGEADFRIPPAASDEQLARAHDSDYVRRVVGGELSAAEQREIGFSWTSAIVERSRRSSGATLAAARAALAGSGCAVNLAGGTHHAQAGKGSGFCVFNDVAVTVRALQAEDGVGRIAVIDCDVHQGDGSAQILGRDEGVFTFSIHGEKNFPSRKQTSHLDIGLADDTGDEVYLATLDGALSRIFGEFQPACAIYLAGADPFVGDRLGRLALSKAGLLERDRRVLEACRTAGVPVAIAMAGGYADVIEDIVDIHAATVLLAAELYD